VSLVSTGNGSRVLDILQKKMEHAFRHVAG